MRIFGRDPAVILGLVAVVVQALVAFNTSLTDEQQGLINAAATALMGVAIAFMAARDQIVPAVGGAVVAVLQLAVAFGANLTQEQIGTAAALLTTLLAFWLRTQVTAPVAPDGSTVERQTVRSSSAP